MLKARITLALFVLGVLLTRPSYADESGILLLAHGGDAQWNARVTELAASRSDKTNRGRIWHGHAREHPSRG